MTRKWRADGTTAAGKDGRSAQQRSDQDFAVETMSRYSNGQLAQQLTELAEKFTRG